MHAELAQVPNLPHGYLQTQILYKPSTDLMILVLTKLVILVFFPKGINSGKNLPFPILSCAEASPTSRESSIDN